MAITLPSTRSSDLMKTISQGQFSTPVDLDEVAEEAIVVHHHDGVPATRIVVFVHGLGGSRYGAKSTWGNFPKFIFEDIPDLDVGLYQYDSLFKQFGFRSQIEL